QHDSVEHTARRAGPSVSDAGDDDVAGLAHLLDDLLVRRDRRVVLAEHARLAGAVLRLQDLPDLHEELVGVVLRVLDQAYPLALEGAGAVDVGDRLLRRLGGGVQKLGTQWTSLGVGREERREEGARPRVGMNAEKHPGGPPAATTSMSSGSATIGRSFVSSPGAIAPGMRLVRLRCAIVFFVFSNRNWRISFLPQPLPAIVRMCSPARVTTYWGWRPAPPECFIESASVVSTPSASGESWL